MTSAASVTTLPPLGPEERAHSDRVAAHIRAFIAERGGVIGFDAFMRLALYAPGLGYYSAGATKLGAAGDFGQSDFRQGSDHARALVGRIAGYTACTQ